MFSFDMVQCGLIVLALMVCGEFLSHKLKAAVPSILISAVLFLILVWGGILPSTVIEDSGLMHLTGVAMMFVILGMGISINIRQLLDNWRVVALAALSYLGQTAILVLVISAIFDANTAFGALPGGAAVALIVQERARALGHDQIVVLSVLLLAVQGLVACPLVSLSVKKEVARYQKEKVCPQRIPEEAAKAGTMPHRTSANASLLRFFAAAWLASRLERWTGISCYVFCLILGILLTKIGFFHEDEMDNTKSHGLLSLMMMARVLNGFSGATPEMFLSLLKPLCCILLVDVVSIFLLSQIFGKLFRFSRPMAFAICLNVMVGFPLNLMLAQDIIDFLAASPEENKWLNREIATKIVIAGFTSVTFLSTIGAGLLVQFMR